MPSVFLNIRCFLIIWSFRKAEFRVFPFYKYAESDSGKRAFRMSFLKESYEKKHVVDECLLNREREIYVCLPLPGTFLHRKENAS